MITVPTTLILGAGSSRPYGLPTGAELRTIILDRIEQQDAQWQTAFDALRLPFEFVARFRNEFWRSRVPSIDAFLEHRPEFLDAGRTVIALALIPKEHEDSVLSP